MFRVAVTAAPHQRSARPRSDRDDRSRCLTHSRLELGARVMQVGLDGSFRPTKQQRDFLDRESPVVVQQERAAQPWWQALDQVADVYVLRRMPGKLLRDGCRDGPDRA